MKTQSMREGSVGTRYSHPGVKVALAAVVLSVGGIFAAHAFAAPPMPTPRASTASVANVEPAKVVTAFDAALLAAMKEGKQAGIEQRVRIMNPAVEAAFDLPRVSQIVLGPYWKSLTPEQHRTFAGLLRTLIVASYASNFDSYAGQTFKLMRSERHGSSAFVSTQLINPNTGKTHSFDYILESTSGRWGIVNVIADGVSDMAVKRAEYTAVMQKGSFSDLVKALKKQIAQARGAN